MILFEQLQAKQNSNKMKARLTLFTLCIFNCWFNSVLFFPLIVFFFGFKYQLKLHFLNSVCLQISTNRKQEKCMLTVAGIVC